MVVHTLEQRFAKWVCDRLTEDADFGKKKNHLFRWSSFWSWRVCKQAKLSHLGRRIPARIHLKAYASKRVTWGTENPHANVPKTSHCLVRLLVQRHNWAIFLRKWARRDRYSQWRSLSGHVERIFIHKNWRGGYWFYVPHSRNYTWCFMTRSWRLHYQPQSWCRLATSELWFDTVGLLFVGCRQR